MLHQDGYAMPLESIEMDLNTDKNKCFQQGYFSLLQDTGWLYKDPGFHIIPEECINRHYLFGYDSSSDMRACRQFARKSRHWCWCQTTSHDDQTYHYNHVHGNGPHLWQKYEFIEEDWNAWTVKNWNGPWKIMNQYSQGFSCRRS